MIPALHKAEFYRYGVMHRNTFINSPKLLNADFSLRENENLFFAGQLTGVEGYMESAASGILAGINAVRRLNSQEPVIYRLTQCSALLQAIYPTNMWKIPANGRKFRCTSCSRKSSP